MTYENNSIKTFFRKLFTIENLIKILIIFFGGVFSRYLMGNYFNTYVFENCGIIYLICYSVLTSVVWFTHEFLTYVEIIISNHITDTFLILKSSIKEIILVIISKIPHKKAYVFNVNVDTSDNKFIERYFPMYFPDESPLKSPNLLEFPIINREINIPNKNVWDSSSYILGVKYIGEFELHNFKSLYVKSYSCHKLPLYKELWNKDQNDVSFLQFKSEFGPLDKVAKNLAKSTNDNLPKEIVRLMNSYALNPIPEDMSTKEKCKYFTLTPFYEFGPNVINRPDGAQDLFFKRKT
uniref:Uncharacterized protein n=1 Tax=Clonostachys rogersoniana TaxID=122658 RepID=A0A8F2BR44_CLORO|nr:hypothetical protein [Clonostachys rogersoniana]